MIYKNKFVVYPNNLLDDLAKEFGAKNLLELYFKKFPQKLKSNDYLNFDLSQIDIELEKSMDGRRADVFVKINNIDNPNIPISTITIENKTDTSEHGNQTQNAGRTICEWWGFAEGLSKIQNRRFYFGKFEDYGWFFCSAQSNAATDFS